MSAIASAAAPAVDDAADDEYWMIDADCEHCGREMVAYVRGWHGMPAGEREGKLTAIEVEHAASGCPGRVVEVCLSTPRPRPHYSGALIL